MEGSISLSKILITLALGYLAYLVYVYLYYTFKLRSNIHLNLPLCPSLPICRVVPMWSIGLSLGGDWTLYFDKRNVYQKLDWNAFLTIPFFPAGSLCTYVGDVEAIKEIVNDRIRFPKPVKVMRVLNAFGLNVVTTEGDEWKKHRRISQPAFSDRNIRLVWSAATSVTEELIDEHWDNKPEVRVGHTLDIAIQLALMVLSVAAFGKPMSWKAGFSSPGQSGGAIELTKGHKLTFARSLYVVSTNLIKAFVLPSWCLVFTQGLREIGRAFFELQLYMDEIIEERRLEYEQDPQSASQRADLLANLIVAAAEDQDEENTQSECDPKKKGLSLSQSDLRGNVFIYLIAGHESTSHALTYVFGLLALYPEEQEKLYRDTMEVLDGRQATYEDFPRLTRALAVFYEALRMYPPVTIIPKKAAGDTVLRVSSSESNGTCELVLPKDTKVSIHTTRVHYDPHHYPDPEKFNSDRFMDNNWNKDAFLAFSLGARACLGRKFAEVEVVAVLTALISRYTIHLTDEMESEFNGLNLSMKEKEERLLKSKVLSTTTPLSVPLTFRRRKSDN